MRFDKLMQVNLAKNYNMYKWANQAFSSVHLVLNKIGFSSEWQTIGRNGFRNDRPVWKSIGNVDFISRRLRWQNLDFIDFFFPLGLGNSRRFIEWPWPVKGKIEKKS